MASKKKYKGPERRTYMRMGVDCAVDYLKLNNDLKPMGNSINSGYTKDMSGAGISFISPERIPDGAFLELHIKIPTVNKSLTAIGKIVRCDSEKEKKFEMAVAFIWISEKDKALIDTYVKDKKLENLRSELKE